MSQSFQISSLRLSQLAMVTVILGLLAAWYAGQYSGQQWRTQEVVYQVTLDENGVLSYQYKGKPIEIQQVAPYATAVLHPDRVAQLTQAPALEEEWVVREDALDRTEYVQLTARYHFGWWSLLPAFLAIILCVLTREPLVALFTGVVAGALLLGEWDITDGVLIPNLATKSAATILLLYLWLVGGLMGIWSRTGAARAFAEFMTRHFVRGPKSARMVSWLLGIIFFQGGSISVVLVGTIVKPVADQENVSHEELAYIVDSTASPVASVLAFNAWPIYVQALIFIPGVGFLATEADRIRFFFKSVPFSFYGILAVLGTLALSLGYRRFSGAGLRAAHARASSTGELDGPNARPLRAKELQHVAVPENYQPSIAEFFAPLMVLVSIAVGTFVALGTPKINWAFGLALLSAVLIALVKGMALRDVTEGIGDGLKGVVLASVIMLLAITVGGITQEIGAGIYLVEQLGSRIPFWALPVSLQIITMIIAFSTGSSWGTYAVAFPLAMPLAWSVAQASGLENPEVFLSICFATVLNGSVYGDQCSPISDTTILSSMTTGCDLMDHVRTQIVPASFAAGTAALLWTLSAVFLAA